MNDKSIRHHFMVFQINRNRTLFFSSELERQIHDAEIFLQKTEEMWAARSNERELAYEKEMFHSTDSSSLLSEVNIFLKRLLCMVDCSSLPIYTLALLIFFVPFQTQYQGSKKGHNWVTIFIYSCSAQLISYEIDCFYSQ
jgi:hypothetical protein